MSQPSFSASQPLPSSMPGAVPQGLRASASLGAFFPNSHSGLQDATNSIGLNLPPNAMRILAGCQASRLFSPALPNPLQQPVSGAAKPFATTKTRATVRSHSQPDMGKSRALSAFSRKVITKPVAQPVEAAQYRPPPMKARARRETKSKARATASAVASGPSNLSRSASVAQAASQCEATPNTDSQPVHNYSRVAMAISQQPGFENIPIDLVKQVLPSLMGRRSTTSWVAGDTTPLESGIGNSMAHNESFSSPDMGVPAMEVAGLLPGSSSPMVQPEGSPPVQQSQSVPAIARDDIENSMEFSAAIRTRFQGWYPRMNAIPEWEVPTMELPTVEEAPTSDVTTAVNEQNAGEEPSAALEYILDLEHSSAVEAARSETRITLPTREDFEGSLSPLPNDLSPSADPGREFSMGEAGPDEFEKLINELLTGSGWGNFFDFEGAERV